MAIALDPSVPRVWRSPDELQFGVEHPRLVLRGVEPWEERVIAALDGGLTLHALRVVASRAGAPEGAADALLDRLAPVLAAEDAQAPPTATVVLDGSGPTASLVAGLLGSEGFAVRSGGPWAEEEDEAPDVAVIVASYAVEPARHARWVRRDVPHVPIVFGDGGATVGPFVEPGAGPCLRCVDLHRTDSDPAWPALAAQLHQRTRPGETALLTAAVASLLTASLLERLRNGSDRLSASSVRIGGDGVREEAVSWEPHPECGCLGLPEREGAAPPRSVTPGG